MKRQSMDLLATSIRIPTKEELRSLSLSDLAIASALAEVFRDRLKEFVQIDPYCVYDPFSDKDDYTYAVFVDRQNPNRIVAITANKKDPLPQLPWSTITGDRIAKLHLSKDEAFAAKKEIMPKDTNNFYPVRRGNRISGYIMFAFQVCGLR